MKNQQGNQIKRTIWYAGSLCKFEVEVNTIDEAQYWINYYNGLGFKSCSLHERSLHQIYVELKLDPRRRLTAREKMRSLVDCGECANMDEARIYLIDCGEI